MSNNVTELGTTSAFFEAANDSDVGALVAMSGLLEECSRFFTEESARNSVDVLGKDKRTTKVMLSSIHELFGGCNGKPVQIDATYSFNRSKQVKRALKDVVEKGSVVCLKLGAQEVYVSRGPQADMSF